MVYKTPYGKPYDISYVILYGRLYHVTYGKWKWK